MQLNVLLMARLYLKLNHEFHCNLNFPPKLSISKGSFGPVLMKGLLNLRSSTCAKGTIKQTIKICRGFSMFRPHFFFCQLFKTREPRINKVPLHFEQRVCMRRCDETGLFEWSNLQFSWQLMAQAYIFHLLMNLGLLCVYLLCPKNVMTFCNSSSLRPSSILQCIYGCTLSLRGPL